MDINREQEQQLIEGILDGGRDGYRVLVDRYAPMVFHLLRRFVNDDDEVEELAQQVFVKAYERLDRFNGDSKFSSWLYMIAKNQCRDYVTNIRRQNRRFSEMDDHVLKSQLADESSPDQGLEQAESMRLLEEALGQIGTDYAEAFLMKYRDGMTYKAMSMRLDMSVKALKVRVHRARKALKEYMENQRSQ